MGLRCPLPPGSEAVHCGGCIAHCPQAEKQCIARVALPSPLGNEAVYCRSSTAPKECCSALQQFPCPLPRVSEAVQ